MNAIEQIMNEFYEKVSGVIVNGIIQYVCENDTTLSEVLDQVFVERTDDKLEYVANAIELGKFSRSVLEGTIQDIVISKFNIETNPKDKVELLTEFLKGEFPDYIQMFNIRNIAGDKMETIYNNNGITVDYCNDWEYIEIFGLTQEEFNKVRDEVNTVRETNVPDPDEDDEPEDDDDEQDSCYECDDCRFCGNTECETYQNMVNGTGCFYCEGYWVSDPMDV